MRPGTPELVACDSASSRVDDGHAAQRWCCDTTTKLEVSAVVRSYLTNLTLEISHPPPSLFTLFLFIYSFFLYLLLLYSPSPPLPPTPHAPFVSVSPPPFLSLSKDVSLNAMLFPMYPIYLCNVAVILSRNQCFASQTES